MAISEDTARTKAIRAGVQHVSPRFIRWLDDLIGSKKAENGGFFDLFAAFRGHDQPIVTRETTEYKPHKLND